MHWKVWYDGGRTFNSRDDAWADLPDDGFQIFLEYSDRDGIGKHSSGCDCYWVVEVAGIVTELRLETPTRDVDGEPTETAAEVRDRVLVEEPSADVKLGRWQTDEELAAMFVDVHKSYKAFHRTGEKWL